MATRTLQRLLPLEHGVIKGVDPEEQLDISTILLKEIHLNTFAQRVLAFIPQGRPDDLLLPGITPEAVSMAFHRTCKRLGFTDIRLHDLLHTFATWLHQRGIELDVIGQPIMSPRFEDDKAFREDCKLSGERSREGT